MPDTQPLPATATTATEPVANAPVGVPSDAPVAAVPDTPVAQEVAAPTSAAEPAPPAIPDLPPAACAARLAELFPAVFKPGAPKPLKLRIQADVQARAPGIFNKKSLSIFLHRHTTNTAYLRAMLAAPQRADLDGAPAGDVTDEHRQAATTELDRRRAMHEERRAAEREAHRKQHEAHRKAQQAAWPNQAERAQPRAPHAQAEGQYEGRAEGRVQGPAQRQGKGQARAAAQADGQRTRPGAPRRPPAFERPQPDAARRVMDEAPRQPSADDSARSERQMLVRAYEGSTLTKANFCVLKGLTEAQLDAALAQARQDPRPPQREQPRPDVRGGGPPEPPRVGQPGGNPQSHRRNNRP